MKLNTYLHLNGNCREAFDTYARVLGGKLDFVMTYGESPMAKETPKEMLDKVMHVHLTAGDQALMGSDAPPGHFQPHGGFSINIDVSGVAEAERVYEALSQGGEIRMPLQRTFWAERFGMFVDRFGAPWMVNFQGKAMEKAA